MSKNQAVRMVAFLALSACSFNTASAKSLSPEQALKIRRISDLQLSHNGERIALTVSEPTEGTEQNRDIWVLDLGPKKTWRLTTSNKSDRSPRWSPDNEMLAFISNRTDPAQIHLISMKGGEARPLTKSKTAVTAFEWAPDGRSVAFLASLPKTEEEEKKAKDKDDARLVDRDDRPPQLWLIDIASREVRQLTEGRWRISEFAWIPDGDQLVIAATQNDQPELFTTRIYRLNVSGGQVDELTQPAGPFGNLQVSPDGRYIAYVGSRLDGPTPHDLFIQPLSGGKSSNLTAASLDRDVADYAWQTDGSLVIQAASGFTNRFYELTLDGTPKERARFENVHPMGSFSVSDKVLVFVGEGATIAPEVWISEGTAGTEQITDFNKGWADINLVEPEIMTYPSFDETPIEAALLKPADYQEGALVPLIVLVHGGPSGRWSARFHSWGQLLVSKGYAVLFPNIRGSLGYGHDFLVMNRRDWGGGDFRDVMAGVDALIEQGVADPARLGIGGWSYGGYMAAWVVTQTARFKASVSGAPMTNLASEYGTETSSINSYDTWYLGSPYENLDLFMQRSPVAHVKAARTPTLILCGDKDVTDPIGQCTEFHRGLKRYGVETELVIYPREGHGIREEKHQLDLLQRIVDWFDRYLIASKPSR